MRLVTRLDISDIETHILHDPATHTYRVISYEHGSQVDSITVDLSHEGDSHFTAELEEAFLTATTEAVKRQLRRYLS